MNKSRSRLPRWLILASLLLASVSPPLMALEKRVALVIGNSKYQFNPTLKNPVNDATDMADSLRKVGFTVSLLLDATRESMEKAVRDFGERLKGEETIGMLYYSGHGAQSEGQNYLLPVDSDIQDEDELRYKAVDSEAILAKMRTAGNRLNIVVLDACRNNPFPGASRAAARGLSIVKIKVPESLIIYSTDPGSVASDGEGRNSPFTQAFLQQMEVPDQDISIMMRRVSAKVQSATSGAQSPWVSSNLTRDFAFVAGAVAQEKPTAPPAQVTLTPTPAPAVLWVATTTDDSAARAKPAGLSPDGTPSYLIRALFQGSLVPGKFNPKAKAAYVPFGGLENRVTTFELYTGPQEWVPAAEGSALPNNVVAVGYEADGSPLYAIRSTSGKALVPGKLSLKTGQAYISLGGKELAVRKYEILVAAGSPTTAVAPVAVAPSAPVSGKVILRTDGELSLFDPMDSSASDPFVRMNPVDTIDFLADPGVTYLIVADSTEIDTDLALLGPEGSVLKTSKSSAGNKTTLLFNSSIADFVHVQVKVDGQFKSYGAYTLSVTTK